MSRPIWFKWSTSTNTGGFHFTEHLHLQKFLESHQCCIYISQRRQKGGGGGGEVTCLRPFATNTDQKAETHTLRLSSFSSLAPSHFLWYLQWVSLRNSLASRSSLLSGSEQHLDICEPFRGKRILQLPKSQLMLAAMRRQRKEEFSPGMLTSMSKDLGSSRVPFLTQSFS